MSAIGGCQVRQLLVVGKGDLDRNSAKSPGSAVLCEGSLGIRQLRWRSREAGSSSKLCQTFYRRRTQVWTMDLSEVGAEFGSCWHRWEGKRTKEMQNRPEVRFCAVVQPSRRHSKCTIFGWSWGHRAYGRMPCDRAHEWARCHNGGRGVASA